MTSTNVSHGTAADIKYQYVHHLNHFKSSGTSDGNSNINSTFCLDASGTLTASFDKPAHGATQVHVVEILAVDNGGRTARVELYTFTIARSEPFALLVHNEADPWTKPGELTLHRNSTQVYTYMHKDTVPAVGVFYKMHRPRVSYAGKGNVSWRYMLEGAPDLWFVNSLTGEASGTFSHSDKGSLEMKLVAMASTEPHAGERFTVRTLRYKVQQKPVFKIKPSLVKEVTQSMQHVHTFSGWKIRGEKEEKEDKADESDCTGHQNETFFVGDDISTPKMPYNRTLLFDSCANHDCSRVTYTLQTQPGTSKPPLVDNTNGHMVFVPQEAANYTITLIATDGAGATVNVTVWSMRVEIRPQLTLSTDWNAATLNETNGYQAQYASGKQTDRYVLAAPHDNKRLFEPPTSRVIYTVHFKRLVDGTEEGTIIIQPQPGRFLIESETGTSVAIFDNVQTGDYVGYLIARDISNVAFKESVLQVIVKNWIFSVHPHDTLNLTNGPNGKDCAEQQQRKDTVPFDHQFTCKCHVLTLGGPNCNTNQGSAALDSADTTIVAVALSLVIALIFLALATWKARRYRRKYCAYDFKAKRASLENHGDCDFPLAGVEVAAGAGIPRELARRHVTLTDQIGQGQFGEVSKGLFDDPAGMSPIIVAIKSVQQTKGTEATEELAQEATIMVRNYLGSISFV